MTSSPVVSSTASSYDRNEWAKGYRSLKRESDYWIDEIEGTIPEGLTGTLFRNGPGMLDVAGTPVQHPFDGDGMICAFTFQSGRVHFRNRYVQTEGYVAEQKAEKILYRGVFGTQRSGGFWANAFDTKLKNIANTQVIYWGGKLLALWEAAEPHRLDPTNLETLGLEFFNGKLKSGDAFAAHPWVDPASQFDQGEPCLVNFSIQAGLSFKLNLYELDLAGEIVRQQSHQIPGFAFIHDFAITPNYCIFFQNPMQFNPLPFVFGLRGAGECLQFQPDRPTKMIVIPRDGRSAPQVLEARSGFVFHHANAFEENGQIVVDSICYDSLPSVEPGSDFRNTNFEALSPGQLWRFRLDLVTGTVDRQLLNGRCCEFPVVHPALVGRSYRYAYMGAADRPVGNMPLQAIAKVDVTTGAEIVHSFAPHGYVSEPIFVPRNAAYPLQGAEDDGWVLTLVYDGQRDRSSLVILDGQTLEPVTRLWLKHHVPYGLHGTFTPEVFIN
ncbi:MAG: Apocarotenoid-15,15'-oxygenase [Alkalinema sp. CACIAM 70d]|nr:MAG: Apocarotenoid-15,15'-oxygenase [Alkalinema sp. CACIAM 70d]